MTTVSRYAGGHLFNLYDPRTKLEEQIAHKLSGMTESDFKKLDLFRDRTIQLTNFAN